jgi:hypothetical protein
LVRLQGFRPSEVESGLLLQETSETKAANWFTTDELTSLNLSTDRVTLSQLQTIYKLASDSLSAALCD